MSKAEQFAALSDGDFERIFEQTREQFLKLPGWQQTMQRKAKGFF